MLARAGSVGLRPFFLGRSVLGAGRRGRGARSRPRRRAERGRRSARRARPGRGSPSRKPQTGSSSKYSMRSGAGSRARRPAADPRARPAASPPRAARARARAPGASSREVRELVRADQEDRVLGRPPLLEGVDRAGVPVELDLRLRNVLEREPRELEARVGRRRRPLVPGVLDDEDEEPLEAEVLDRGPGERDVADVRRVEGAAQDPGSLPLELLVAHLDRRAALDPDLAQRLLELVGRRRRPDDPVAAVGAQDAETRAARAAAGTRGTRAARLSSASGARRGRARRAPASARRSLAGGARGRDDADDPLVLDREPGRASRRSTLFRTTICGRSSSPAPYAASSRSIVGNRSSRSSSEASRTWTRRRARSRCARNS